MQQTRERVFRGNTRAEGKILSLFEPSTEVIRKGKAAKPNEFGKMVKLQEAENQIVIDYEVYDRRPNDSDLLIPAIETHQAKFGRTPTWWLQTRILLHQERGCTRKQWGQTRLHSQSLHQKPRRKREQKKRWFRKGQKWRTGCEGASAWSNAHGLNRCRYKGDTGCSAGSGSE